MHLGLRAVPRAKCEPAFTHADSGGLLLLPPARVLVVAHRRPLSPPDSVYGKGFWFVWGLFVWLLAAAPRSPLLSRGSFRNVRGRCGINIQILLLFSPPLRRFTL